VLPTCKRAAAAQELAPPHFAARGVYTTILEISPKYEQKYPIAIAQSKAAFALATIFKKMVTISSFFQVRDGCLKSE
jgi:hypothetical protein